MPYSTPADLKAQLPKVCPPGSCHPEGTSKPHPGNPTVKHQIFNRSCFNNMELPASSSCWRYYTKRCKMVNINAVKRKALTARLTLNIVRRIVVLFSHPTYQTEYRRPAQRSLQPSALRSLSACVLPVPCLILDHNSLMPSAGSLYLSCRWSSGKGQCVQLVPEDPFYPRHSPHPPQLAKMGTLG